MGIRQVKVEFSLADPLTEEQAASVACIPGVTFPKRGRILTARGSGARTVAGVLRWLKVDFEHHQVGQPDRTTPLEEIPGVSAYAIEKAKPFQRDALAFTQRLGGGLLEVPCGGGKTWMFLWWIASYPGRALIVTSSGALYQIPEEISKLFAPGAMPYAVIDREQRATAAHASIRDLSHGHPPWKVVNPSTGQVYERLGAGPLPKDFAELADLRRVAEIGIDSGWSKDEEDRIWRARCIVAVADGLSCAETAVRLRRSQDEVEGWVAQLRAQMRADTYQKDLGLADDVKVVIIPNYLITSRREALAAWGAPTVVLDECHHFKDHSIWAVDEDQSGTTFTLKETQAATAHYLSQNASRVLLTSATPHPDRVRDWWGQLTMIEGPYSWGRFRVFAERYCNGKMKPISRFNPRKVLDSKGSSNPEELRSRIDLLRFKVSPKVTHAELPPLRVVVRHVQQRDLTQAHIGVDERGAWVSAKRAGTAGKLTYMLCLAAAMVRPLVVSVLAEKMEAGQKVIGITGWHSDCNRMGAELKKAAGKKVQVWIAHGGNTSPEERKAVQDAYMAHPGPCALIGTLDAWGESRNLHDTDYMGLAYVPWTPIEIKQIIGRIWRLGMSAERNPVVELFIGRGTKAEDVEAAVLSKFTDLAALCDMDDDALVEGLRDKSDKRSREQVLADMAARLMDTDDDRKVARIAGRQMECGDYEDSET